MLLYLRTKRHLEYEVEVLERLTEDSPNVWADWLVFGEDAVTWDDGLVLRLPNDRPAYDLAKQLAGALGSFRAWAILGDDADYVESTGVGPLGRFVERQGRRPMGSLYLMASAGDQRHDETVETIRAHLGEDCSRVFSFGEGHVLFFPQKTEPLSITAQRHARLLERFKYWTVCDENHEPHRSGTSGNAVWAWESLYDLRFDADESDDDGDNS
jgi:hypothetical protein